MQKSYYSLKGMFKERLKNHNEAKSKKKMTAISTFFDSLWSYHSFFPRITTPTYCAASKYEKRGLYKPIHAF